MPKWNLMAAIFNEFFWAWWKSAVGEYVDYISTVAMYIKVGDYHCNRPSI
jgi:hypothetical protein